MTYLFITHDLAMAAHLADEIVVMNRGRIVNRPAEAILKQPKHDILVNCWRPCPDSPAPRRGALEQ